MEREAVLHWLQDVQAATCSLEELNEGFLDPDKSNHSGRYLHDSSRTSCAQQPTKQTCDNPPQIVTQSSVTPPTLTPSSLTPSASQAPGVATAATRRAAFKQTKSNTLCGGDDSGVHMKRPFLTKRAPSVDVLESNGKLRQSSISPLPSFNPDFVLPTIHLPQSEFMVPERKPLMQPSSTTFLSKLMTKTPRQYLLQSSRCRSVDLPECVKSAPSSPHLKKSNHSSIPGVVTSYSQWDLSQMGHNVPEPVAASSTLTRKNAVGAMSDGAGSGGSCVAEQGELSDVASSGDMGEEGAISDGGEVGVTYMRAKFQSAVDGRVGVAAMEDGSRGVVEEEEGDLLQRRMKREGNKVSTDNEKREGKYLIGKISKHKSEDVEPSCSAVQMTPPVLRQATGEVSLSPSLLPKTEQPKAKQPTYSLAELLQVGSGAEIPPTRVSSGLPGKSPLEGSFAFKLLDIGDHVSPQGLPSPTPSPGHDSLTFHDHHLGRVATRGLVRSPTLDEGSMGPTHGHWNKLRGHSPLLRRTEPSTTACDKNVQDLLSDRTKKWKPMSVGWLSKPAEIPNTESLQ